MINETDLQYLNKYHGDDKPKIISNYKDRSIYDSNCIEFYKPIDGSVIKGILPNRYYVSSFGNTYNSNTGKPIGLSTHRKGYKQFAVITKDENGNTKQKTKKLHRYIMETFCPINETNIHYEINHIDCDKLNNDIKNLEYCTSSENTIHAINNGLKKVFGNNYKVNLTYDQVHIIQSMKEFSTNEIRQAIGNPSKEEIADVSLRLIATGVCRSNN